MNPLALRQRIKARLDELLDEAFAANDPPRTIDQVEALALQLGRKAQEQIAQELVANAAGQAQADAGVQPEEAHRPASKWTCPCQHTAWYKGERAYTLVTLAATVVVTRSYYYCRRCDQGFCPTDALLGIGAGALTLRVQQEVARLSAFLAYEGAVHLLGELTGVWVSAKQGQRVVLSAQAPLAGFLAQREQSAFADTLRASTAPDVLYVEADGVQTPMVEGGWRETKVGLARPLKANGEPLGPTRYISHLGTAEEFGPFWYALGAQAGSEQARLTVALGDGAAWIWNLAASYFPGCIEILDCWHAQERLFEIGRLAYPTDAPARTTWVEQQRALLLCADWEPLEANLARVAQAYKGCAETVGDTLGYYRNHRSRMDYPRYRALGLQIGSGAAESGCKQVVTQRLKGAGMRWKEAGAQVVSRLRCLLLSQQWNEFCAFWNQLGPTPGLSPLS